MHYVAYHELRLPLMRNASDYDDLDLEEFMWEADIRSLKQDDSDFTPHYDEFRSYLLFLSWDDETTRLTLYRSEEGFHVLMSPKSHRFT